MSLASEHPAPPELPEVPDGVTPQAGEPRWHPGLAIAAFVGAFLTAGLFGSIILVSSGDVDDPPPWANILATLFQDAVLIGVAVAFAAMVAKPRPWHFGLRPPRSLRRAIGYTVLAYVTFLVFSAVFLSAVGADQNDDLPQELGADEGTGAMLGIAFLVCVAAPLAEEFFFRGYLYPALRTWRGPWIAAVLNGVLFGLVHAGGSDLAFLLPLAFLGFLFCVLRERTGSLYPAIVLHAINNSVAFGVAMDWDWQVPVVLASSLALIGLVLAAVQRLGGAGPRTALRAA